MIKTILAAALLIAISLACSSEPEKVTMGTEGYYHPYNFINDDGEDRRLRARIGRRALPPRQSRMRLGHQRLGHHHPQPECRQLRHHHGRHEHHRPARRAYRLHPSRTSRPARRSTSPSPAPATRPPTAKWLSRRPPSSPTTCPSPAPPWWSTSWPKSPSPPS